MDLAWRSARLSAKPAKTRRSRSSNFDRSFVGYAIRSPSAQHHNRATLNKYLSGTSITLAIEHTRAYMCAITDQTLGVSG